MKARQSTLIMVLIAVATLLHAADYYVDIDNVSGAQAPYTNWPTAATNIQFAVNAASAGDTVWVAPGRYSVPTNYVIHEGTNVVYIDKPLTLRASGAAAETIVDGGGTNRGMMIDYSADTSRRFVIDGFTVSNCFAVGQRGGGIYFDGTGFEWTGTVANCVILNSKASTSGGGLVSYNGFSSKQFGLVVSNCVIRNNEAIAGHGPGIYRYANGTLSVVDSCIEDNTATGGSDQVGGGIYSRYGAVMVEKTVIRGNIALSGGNSNIGGGGIYRLGSGPVTLRNCLLANNTGYRGGAVHIQDASGIDLEVFNCTIVGNNGAYSPINFRNSGGASGTFQVYNSIIYSNQGDEAIGNLPTAGTVMAFTNCCTSPDPDVTGSGNITDNPAFLNMAAGNYRLPKDSPCVNQGYNQLWMNGALDLDGYPRIDTAIGVVDMGCYEVQYRGTIVTIQ